MMRMRSAVGIGPARVGANRRVGNAFRLVTQLGNPVLREYVLFELCKERNEIPDLAPLLWNFSGAIRVLLGEIIAVYPLLDPPVLTERASTRVCNALALLQCVAVDPRTSRRFLSGKLKFTIDLFAFD